MIHLCSMLREILVICLSDVGYNEKGERRKSILFDYHNQFVWILLGTRKSAEKSMDICKSHFRLGSLEM